jgi:hypothetical protein
VRGLPSSFTPHPPLEWGIMNSVIFARTRYVYDSYIEFWKLVKLSNFPICYVDEIDWKDKDKTYIVTPVNGEWNNGWEGAKARIILWDLEWREERPNIPGVSEVWASDVWYANHIEARYVLLGSHPGLCLNNPNEYVKDYDVIWFAYMTWRRSVVHTELEKYGMRMPQEYLPRPEQHQAMLRSRLCVHVHQHEHVRTIAPQRWAMCAAYRLPILSENVIEPGSLVDDTFWADYRYISEFAHLILSGKYANELKDSAHALYSRLCERNTFRTCVEGALLT